MAVRDYWRRFTRLDQIIVIVMIVVCALLFALFGWRKPGQAVQVMQDQEIIFTAPLGQDSRAELRGPLGVTRMEISHGQARIISSPCPYKVCIGMGDISRQGELIACVPNRLLVQVVGSDAAGKDPGYDLLSR